MCQMYQTELAPLMDAEPQLEADADAADALMQAEQMIYLNKVLASQQAHAALSANRGEQLRINGLMNEIPGCQMPAGPSPSMPMNP